MGFSQEDAAMTIAAPPGLAPSSPGLEGCAAGAGGTLSIFPHIDNELLTDFLQDKVLEFVAWLGPAYSADPEQRLLLASKMFSSWAAFGVALKVLGFLPDSADPWAKLGMARDEGPEPTVEDLASRRRLLLHLLELADLAPWAGEVADARMRLRQVMEDAFQKCDGSILEVVRMRQKRRRQDWPRWMEVEDDFLSSLVTQLHNQAPTAIVFTNLSEIFPHCAHPRMNFQLLVFLVSS